MTTFAPKDLFLSTGRLHSAQGTIEARINASVGEQVRIQTRTGEELEAEVIGFRDEMVQIMPFDSPQNLERSNLVTATGRRMRVAVGEDLLGRIVDCCGRPIDGNGPIRHHETVELNFEAPDPLKRRHIAEPFVTGTRAIDGLITVGLGQRVGVFAGSGVGKSTLLGDIAKQASSDINVVALIGERGREVRPFVEQALGTVGLQRSVLIVSTSDQSALSRIRASETAVMIANWFREQGKNVLLMLDSLTRLAMAQRELGLLLGEPPTSRGYTPSVFQKMAVLLEQLGSSERGSITGLLTVLVDGDDMNEPVADAARSILDGHIVLSRKLAQRNHYPAIDVLASASRVFNEITDLNHQESAGALREILANYQEIEDFIQIGAYQPGQVPANDAAVQLLPAVHNFLKQGLCEANSMDQTKQAMLTIAQAFRTSSDIPALASQPS